MRGFAPSGHRALIAFAFVSLVVLAYFSVAAHPAPAPARSASLPTPVVVTNPADTYGLNCLPCHGSGGEGSDIAPSLKAAGFSELIEPKVSEGGGGMPVFSDLLSQQEIQGVSDYVAQTVADPATHEATPGQGSDVWRLYCTPCHGSTGRGGALTSDGNAPTLGDVSGADALVDMIEGPGEMPAFAGTALTNRQQAAVALYVQDIIADPPSPGGLGLGYLGPVPEGFFALFLGLGGLVVFARWSQGSGGRRDA